MTLELAQLEDIVKNARTLRPRTRELYLQHVRAFLKFKPQTEAPKDQLILVRAELWRDDMQARGVAPQSINVALNALRFATKRGGYEFAEDILTVPVPAKPTKKKRGAKRSNRALSVDEAKKLIQVCNTDQPRDMRDLAIIALGMRTGMLRFSMCQLKLEDVLEDELTFTKKGGDSHTIKLDSCTSKALMPWVKWLHKAGVRTGPLFRSLSRTSAVEFAVGKPRVEIGVELTPDGLYRALKQRAKYAGVKDINPNVFRRTFLALAKKSGATAFAVISVTGHKADGAGFPSKGPMVDGANFLLDCWLESDVED